MPHLVPAVLVLEGVKYCRGYSERPNIPSSLEFNRFRWDSGGYIEATGAFSEVEGSSGSYKLQFDGDEVASGVNVIFDPSKASNYYGASNTVQTASLRGYLLIRYS